MKNFNCVKHIRGSLLYSVRFCFILAYYNASSGKLAMITYSLASQAMKRFFALTSIIVFISFLLLLSQYSMAQVRIQAAIPDILDPWQSWVTRDIDFEYCPLINQRSYAEPDSHICALGGPLKINIDSTSGRFEQEWQVLQPSIIILPGDAANWPSEVLINGKPVTINERDGHPEIVIEIGIYTILGSFEWQKPPTQLPLSPQTAWVDLTVDNQLVSFPRIENNRLLLNAQKTHDVKQDSLNIEVARKVTDGLHINLDTFISLSVAGNTREVVLGKVLPENFYLIGIQSELPSFIDADGLLRVQVKAGEYKVAIGAYAMPDTLVWARPHVSHVWPQDEVWVVQTNEIIRSGKIEGAPFIDADQASMPDDWYNYPSYLLNENKSLSYQIGLRGKPNTIQNELTLKREYWFSFAHQTLQFVDSINGYMTHNWRLNMISPYQLESAEDKDGPILISQLNKPLSAATTEPRQAGIENRYPSVEITARGHVNKRDLDLVSGWLHEFSNISMTLNLPPGTLFVHASNVDSVSNSWVANWNIWNSFIVLFCAIIAFRLFGLVLGVLTGFMIMLIYQEAASPIIFILNLLIALAAKKHLTFEKTRKWVNLYAGLSISLALVASLYFTASQIKGAVYPQLEARLTSTVSGDTRSSVLERYNSGPELEYSKMVNMRQRSDDFDEVTATGSQVLKSFSIKEKYQADAILQTGTGIPDWKWKSYYLNWQTPVSAEQEFSLIVLTTNQYRLLKIVGVALLLLWLFWLTHPAVKSLIARIKPASGAASVLLTCMLFISSEHVFSQHTGQQNEQQPALQLTSQIIPPDSTLQDLREWLLSPPEC